MQRGAARAAGWGAEWRGRGGRLRTRLRRGGWADEAEFLESAAFLLLSPAASDLRPLTRKPEQFRGPAAAAAPGPRRRPCCGVTRNRHCVTYL